MKINLYSEGEEKAFAELNKLEEKELKSIAQGSFLNNLKQRVHIWIKYAKLRGELKKGNYLYT